MSRLDESNWKPFKNLMDATAEQYKTQPMGVAGLRLMFNALSKYPFEAVANAVARHITDPDGGRWFPTSAHLIRQLRGTAEEQATLAWEKVKRAIGTSPMRFDDPVIHYAIERMGGWGRLQWIPRTSLQEECEKFIRWYIRGRKFANWSNVKPELSEGGYLNLVGNSAITHSTVAMIGHDDG